MVRYMQDNENFFRGTFSSTYTAQQRDRDWAQLAERLNATGGAVKTVEKWRKVSNLEPTVKIMSRFT